MSVLESYLAGRNARRQEEAAAKQMAMQQYVADNGEAIMSGDPAALGGLAQYDPIMALQLKAQVEQQKRAQVEAQQSDWRFNKEVQSWINGQSAAEAAATAAKMENAVKGALMTETPEQFDAYVESIGMPELKGKFEMRDALAAEYMSVADVLKARADKTKAPDEPSGVRELRIRAEEAGLKAGTPEYQAFMANGGMPKAGTTLSVDPSTGAVTFSQGGPVEKAQLAREQSAATADTVITKIDQALAEADNAEGILPTTGFIGSKLANTGGTAANNLRTTLDTVRANIAFDKLQAIRASSPTGGALGAVSDKEMSLLQASLSALDQSTDLPTLKRNLQEVRQRYADIKRKLDAYPKPGQAAQPASGGGPVTITSDADYDSLPSGTQFVAPDGTVRMKP